MGNVTNLGTYDVREPKLKLEPDLRPPEFSDDALALDFAEQHREDLRYVAGWSKWLSWDGSKWALDDTLEIFDLARAVCRDASRCHRGQRRVSNMTFLRYSTMK